jgi:hypothetical protein
MNPYYACPSCSSYVKRSDSKCPFCGAANRAPNVARARRMGRMSRAQWLAYGSTLAVVGCTGGGSTTQREAAAPHIETGNADDATTVTVDANAEIDANAEVDTVAVADASAAADSWLASDSPAGVDVSTGADVTTASEASTEGDAATVDASLSMTAEGGLVCNSVNVPGAAAVCDRATQWCFTNHGFQPTGCVSLTTGCASGILADACSNFFFWDAAACAGGTPRCGCLTVTCPNGTCADDDAGGITVSCGTCYGAPPARLERMARLARLA